MRKMGVLYHVMYEDNDSEDVGEVDSIPLFFYICPPPLKTWNCFFGYSNNLRNIVYRNSYI